MVLRIRRKSGLSPLLLNSTGTISVPARIIMTKVAIVGATGPTGIHLAAQLRNTAAAVRVVARSMNKLARLFPARQSRSGRPIFSTPTRRCVPRRL
jgi:hypothetical protein